jgi:hypothetical protein
VVGVLVVGVVVGAAVGVAVVAVALGAAVGEAVAVTPGETVDEAVGEAVGAALVVVAAGWIVVFELDADELWPRLASVALRARIPTPPAPTVAKAARPAVTAVTWRRPLRRIVML